MKTVFTRWKIITQKIGDFQINLLFSLVYFLFIIPVGAVAFPSKDFLNVKKRISNWNNIQTRSSSLKEMKLQ